VQRQVGQADRDVPPGVGAPAGKIVEQRLNAAVAARRHFISTAKAFSSAGLLSPSASTVGAAFVTSNPFHPLHTGSSHGLVMGCRFSSTLTAGRPEPIRQVR
jgi:hypothetical protein